MEKLIFYPKNIEANLNLTGGLIMAERFMAELTRRGMGRQTAYGVVRKCALEANQKGISLESVVLDNPEISPYLSPDEVKKIMNPHTYLGSAVQIVQNVLEDSKNWF
jgi:adenylosuccinate lyase